MYGFVVLGFVVVDSLDEGVVSVVVGAVEGKFPASSLSFVFLLLSSGGQFVVALDVSCVASLSMWDCC